MTWYTFLLFVHVSMAIIWIGGGLMMQLFGVRASMSGEPARMAAVGEDIEWIANRLFIPASLLAFLTGVLLVIESDFYGFGDDWIVVPRSSSTQRPSSRVCCSSAPSPAGSASSMRSGRRMQARGRSA